ncbi:hypothetical protein DU002_12490 [Corallincola holothuriorum]|uniref:Uncharacterized protein n=1 Tax=Corallincola holothuriorum TaxID=2282215 RepID=A0A368NEU3_9GAMM|nr:hypothetical protein [Corallincola holothuriorum]RCU49167.1 hypothetical protein DU002_12490 [Corallincola holothuriorum]
MKIKDKKILDNLTALEKWVWCWVSYLRINETYGAYCQAVEQNITHLKNELETEQLKALYGDFGNILNLAKVEDIYALVNKLTPLFSVYGVESVTATPSNTSQYQPLWIAKNASKSDLKKAFEAYLNNHHEPVTTSQAKYQITSSRALNDTNLLAFQKSLLVYYEIEILNKKPTELAFDISRQVLDENQSPYYHFFGWGQNKVNELKQLTQSFMVKKQSITLKANSKSDVLESEIKMLSPLLKQAKNHMKQILAGNVIIE